MLLIIFQHNILRSNSFFIDNYKIIINKWNTKNQLVRLVKVIGNKGRENIMTENDMRLICEILKCYGHSQLQGFDLRAFTARCLTAKAKNDFHLSDEDLNV